MKFQAAGLTVRDRIETVAANGFIHDILVDRLEIGRLHLAARRENYAGLGPPRARRLQRTAKPIALVADNTAGLVDRSLSMQRHAKGFVALENSLSEVSLRAI